MKQTNILAKLLLAGAVSSVSAFAMMTVDKSNGVLKVSSDINGIVIAKIINPNDEVIVHKQFNGSSFSWTLSGPDGVYFYDVRVIPTQIVSSGDKRSGRGDYAGGMIEVVGGQIVTRKAGGKQ
ncbi:hypothetical protein ACLHDG_02670 [Sulfurovum sp. CS9]|uniref:hypothetical protein n=1 Tax=Sulfurovum sp. CS9 TaxID=3391146 RepID=UPI0039ECA66E